MARNLSSEPSREEKENEFVEIDPTCRYGRYNEVLGMGAFKTVYKAFDEVEGIEVAWNQVKLADFLQNDDELERVYSEVHLLKTLKHKNIIKFYSSWVDTKNDNINFITEVFTSGTLRRYRKKHKNVDLRALKNWSRQILSGLLYLHSHDPPIIHRDLKCDNIFINGNQGEVKIGDLGLAAILRQCQSAHSVLGTPEFMAPELYEEVYTELVDIYAFGMCLLELVTFEYPYAECKNAAQIYKKVTSGIKPASFAMVKDLGIRQFIEKCIAKASERMSAEELLRDPFLQMDCENDIPCHSIPLDNNNSDAIKLEPSTNGIDCTIVGQRKDIKTLSLDLQIADSTGQVHNINFPFDIEEDTSISVAAELVSELDLTDQDVSTVAEMIDTEIQVHFPDWAPRVLVEDHGNEIPSRTEDFEAENEIHTSPKDYHHNGNFVLERLPTSKKNWSDSSKGSSSNSLSGKNLELNSQARDDVLKTEDDLYLHERQDEFSHGFALGDPKRDSRHSIIPCRGKNHVSGNSSSISLMAHDLNENQMEAFLNNDVNMLSENGSKALESVILKLDELLLKQQKEIDDLRERHAFAIADTLRELPLELQSKVFSMCRLKILGDSMQSESEVAWKNH